MTGRPPTANTVRSDALSAWIALGHALRDVLTPCQRDRGAFLSEDAAERAEAAEACRGCLVLDRCAAYAEAQGEAWGVWGGVDRSPGRGRSTTDKPDERTTHAA